MTRPKSAQFKGTGRAFAIRTTEKTMRNVAKAIQQRLTAEKEAEHEVRFVASSACFIHAHVSAALFVGEKKEDGRKTQAQGGERV
jgi:hypothetical protein